VLVTHGEPIGPEVNGAMPAGRVEPAQRFTKRGLQAGAGVVATMQLGLAIAQREEGNGAWYERTNQPEHRNGRVERRCPHARIAIQGAVE
jgi:hypothetical protein